MMVIKVYEQPFFGHGTTCVHQYRVSEGLKSLHYDRYQHKLTVEFDSCKDKLELKVDQLDGITIEEK